MIQQTISDMNISSNIRLMTLIAITASLVTISTSTIYVSAYEFTLSTPDYAEIFSINTDNTNLAKVIGEQFAIVYSGSPALASDLGENATIGISQTDWETFIQNDIGKSIDKLVNISDTLQAKENGNTAGNATDISGITIKDDNAAGIIISIKMD